jgi:glycosyltransferase involved in cell wall biosynthesis
MKLPSYSVVILTHSRPKYLKLLLDSVGEQTHKPEKVFVVLNGKGQSPELLKQYEALEALKWPANVKWIRSPETNIPLAVNLAVDLTQTEWFAGISDDDLVAPRRFESQLRLCKDTGATISAGAANLIDENGAPIPASHPTAQHFAGAGDRADLLRQVFLDNRLIGSTQIFQTEAIRRAGGMEKDLLLVHDFDLTLKLIDESNYCYDPVPYTKFRIHGGSLFAGKRDTALIELGRVFNRLEADPSSLFFRLLAKFPVEAYVNLVSHPAYAYRWLARRIQERGGFGGRLQTSPEFELTGEEHSLLQSLQKMNGALVPERHLSASTDYAASLETEIAAQARLIGELQASQNVLTDPTVQTALKIKNAVQTHRFHKVPLILAKFGTNQRMKNAVNRRLLRVPSESLPSALKNLPGRVRWRRGQGTSPEKIVNDVWPVDRPMVSVVIPCFNYGEYVGRAVQSVLTQTWRDLEVIVVEGGSTDGKTPEIVRSLEGDRLRCVYQSAPTSVSLNRQRGLEAVRGKYVVFLDADDWFEPTYLEKAVYLMETSGVDVVTPYVRLSGTPARIRVALRAVSGDLWQTQGIPLPEIFEANTCSTSAMFRHSFWKDQAIGYHTDAGYELEDWDFWIRLSSRGARFAVLPEPLHVHRLHGNSLTDALFADYALHIEKVRKTWEPVRQDYPHIFKAIHRQRQAVEVQNPWENLIRTRSESGKEINVLLCVPWFDFGGSSVLLSEVFTRLCEKKVKVTAVATTPDGPPESPEGIALYTRFAPESFDLCSWRDEKKRSDFLSYLTMTRKPDVLMIVGSALTYDNLCRLRTAAPQMKVIDHLYNPIGHIANNDKHRGEIDFNIVANQEVREKLLSLGEQEKRIRPILHGIDVDHYNVDNVAYVKATEIYPWKDESRQFVLGFFGRLSEEKAPADLLYLAVHFPECRFLMAGTGPLQEVLVQRAAELGVQDRVHFAGRIPDGLQFYRSVDAVVIPSRIEGLPLVLLETLAMKLPAVAANVGHMGHVIETGKSGFVYESGNLDALKAVTKQLLALTGEQRRAFGERGRKRVEADHSLGDCANQYLDVLFRLTGKKDFHARKSDGKRLSQEHPRVP